MNKNNVVFLHEPKLRKERDFYKNIVIQCLQIYNNYMLDDNYDPTESFNQIGAILRQNME